MKLCLCILLIFSQWAIHCSYAQSPSPAFIRLSTRQGLSQGHVNSILKDDKGFMWFATDGGLNKYNGYTFQVFKNITNNPHTISNDLVYDIAEDKAGYLWVATGSGLDRLDYKKEIFTHFRPGHDIAVNDVLIDHNNNIWLGSTEGLYLFNEKLNSFKNYAFKPGAANCLSDDHIYHLVEDNLGMIWIATQNGLNCFNPVTEQFTVYKSDPANRFGLQTNWIRTVYKDQAGSIWVGTLGSGIARYNPAAKHFISFKKNPLNSNSLAHNDVLSFAEDPSGNLWIGTENGGISVFDRLQNKFTAIVNNPTDPQSLSNNSVYSLYKDDIGNMWAGTWSNGVNFLPAIGKKFTAFSRVPGDDNSLSNPSVLSIVCDDNNSIWIGTDGGGLNEFDMDTKHFTHYTHAANQVNTVHNNFIITLIKLNTGLLALGYHRGGLDIFDTRTGYVKKHISISDREDNKFEISVNCLYKDSKENLWVGTWGGGVKLFDRRFNMIGEFLHSGTGSNSINNDFINCITEDHEGNIWIATEEGVNKLNTTSNIFTQYQHTYGEKKTIISNEVNQIFEDTKNRVWIATNSGLDLLDKTKQIFVPFTKEEGLPSNSIQSMAEDANGMLWLGTSNGLAAFNPDTKKSRNYSVDDGLQGQEFKNNCWFVNKNGFLFFGGTDGFNYFHPDSLKDNKNVPPVYITNLQVFNKSRHPGDSVLENIIAETKILTLSHKQSVLTFEFAALNYTFSEKNQYAYKLEGFDDNWIQAGTHRSATYTNLDAGTYTLRVKGSNNDGIWTEKGSFLVLVITPPFWKTWWFISLLVIAVAGLIAVFYNYRVALIKHQKKILEQQVQLQTGELVQLNKQESAARIEAEKARSKADEANQKLLISNREMEQFAYVVSHDLKEPLRTTTSFIALLQKKYSGQFDAQANKYFNFITDAAERMKTQINDLLEFSRIGATAKLVTIDCNQLLKTVLLDIDAAVKETNATITNTPLPVINGYATEIKLLFQNLLINAIKFRKKETPPVIDISAEDMGNYWQFAFKDNGIGIAPEHSEKIFMIFQRLHGMAEYEGSGIGLSHCQKIVALHNGRIWVTSAVGEGSTFYFTLQKNIAQ